MPGITHDWVKEKMEQVLGEEVVVKRLEKEENPAGFLSTVFYATIEVKSSGEEIELFVKAAHEDKEMAQYVAGESLDKLEIQFYQEIVPDLIKFEKDKSGRSVAERIFPKFYAGGFGDSFLILENLCSKKFQTINVDEGLNEKEMENFLKTLAEFHAATIAMGRSRCLSDAAWNWRSAYKHLSDMLDKMDDDPMIAEEAKGSIKKLREKYQEFPESELETKLIGYSKNLSSLCRTEPLGLIHCDLWGNNLMINSAGEMKLLDFQFIGPGDPMFDLGCAIFVNSNQPFHENPAQLEVLLHSYYTAITARLGELGSDGYCKDFDQFKQKFNEIGLKAATLFGLLSSTGMDKHKILVDRFWTVLHMENI